MSLHPRSLLLGNGGNDTAALDLTLGTDPSPSPVELDKLYPALVECFGIILLGYIAGRFDFLSDVESKGINTFVGTFALPALIFGSLCKLTLSEVNWMFLVCILLAKGLLFMVVLLVSLVAIRPLNPGKAGLYAIFTTQSNDFALGYPILVAIYGQSHPECPAYLYLIAPISLVILNPIGFICMEIGKNQTERSSTWKKVLGVAKSILTNPIIFMTVAGVVGNVVFQGQPPAFLAQFLATLGSAFSASALFLLGVRMVGRVQTMTGATLVVPFILIVLKTIALPLIAREIVSQLIVDDGSMSSNDTEHLSNFAFLYGTFPTAPSVFVYAAKYDLEQDMVASAMVACTFVAAPIMFISAKLLSIPEINPADYMDELDGFLLDVSIIGLIATLWVAFVLIATKKCERVPHSITLALVISQGIACVGAILWSEISCTHGWKLVVQFAFFAFGVYSSRILTALLAVSLFVLHTQGPLALHRWRSTFLAIGFGVPFILVLSIILAVTQETAPHGDKTDPNFQYGPTQAYVALCVLVISFLVTVIAMVLTQRCQRRNDNIAVPHANGARPRNGDDATRGLLDSATDTEEEMSYQSGRPSQSSRSEEESSRESPVAIEDLASPVANGETCCNGNSDYQRSCAATRRAPGTRRYRCDSEHRRYCTALLDSYDVPPAIEAAEDDTDRRSRNKDEFQTFKHNVLLLLLATSMFIGMALCIWTLVMDKLSGIYLELVFLDGFLNFGQGLFALALFGFDANYLTLPLRRWFRKIFYGADSLKLPPWEDLEAETKTQCVQFIKYHLERCMADVSQDIRVRLTQHRAVFRGTNLVDWLLDIGLARDRTDAVAYGRHLLLGRVIRHVDDYLDFYDDVFVYTFVPVERNSRPQ